MDIRGRVLSLLSDDFNGEQLSKIDRAIAVAMSGYRLVANETLPVPLSDLFNDASEYLARKKSKGLAEGTLYQYEMVLRVFCAYMRRPFCEITDIDILRFLDEWETVKGIGKRRKDGIRVILNGFFRFLTDTGKIGKNPMVTVESIKYKKSVRDSLTVDEMEKLSGACTTRRDAALLEVLFSTGCRVSELSGINIDDIDRCNSRIKVTGKGDKERIVFLTDSAISAIDAYLSARMDEDPALFVTEKPPCRRLGKSGIERAIKRIGEKAGLTRRVYPHLIRHTTATYLLSKGMPIDQIQIYLGHASIETTRVYAKTDLTQVKKSFDRCMKY